MNYVSLIPQQQHLKGDGFEKSFANVDSGNGNSSSLISVNATQKG